MPDRHSLDVTFVDHRAVPRRLGMLVVPPCERGIDDDALRQPAGAVVGRGLEVALRPADLVREERVAPLDRPGDRLGVRVDQHLRGIEAVALVRRVRTMHAKPVELARPDVRQVAVPDLVVAFLERNARSLDGGIVALEQAQVHAGRVLREDGEVDAFAIPGCAKGIWLPWPYPHYLPPVRMSNEL